MADVITTGSLGKRYGAVWALGDCSIDLPAGRVAALVGPHGAGKTTPTQLKWVRGRSWRTPSTCISTFSL